MDLTESIAPRSDQLNAEDLLTGPRTFTVEKVTEGNAEQPVNVHLVEFPGRPFKPSKTVRRIMVAAWGKDSTAYTGRRMTLYRDPSVRFGGQDVGGIRVSHMSHIDKRLVLALTVTRGKRAPYTVEPLVEAAAPKITAAQDKRLLDLFAQKGIGEEKHLAGMAHIIGRPIESRTAMTADEYARVTDHLEQLPDAQAGDES